MHSSVSDIMKIMTNMGNISNIYVIIYLSLLLYLEVANAVSNYIFLSYFTCERIYKMDNILNIVLN